MSTAGNLSTTFRAQKLRRSIYFRLIFSYNGRVRNRLPCSIGFQPLPDRDSHQRGHLVGIGLGSNRITQLQVCAPGLHQRTTSRLQVGEMLRCEVVEAYKKGGPKFMGSTLSCGAIARLDEPFPIPAVTQFGHARSAQTRSPRGQNRQGSSALSRTRLHTAGACLLPSPVYAVPADRDRN
jgi:hypothetical protein